MLTASDAYLFGFIILIIAEIFLLIKKVPFKRNFLFATLIIYIVLVLSVTIFPIPFQIDGYDFEYNFIPTASIISEFSFGLSSAIRTVGGNILMLVPFGVLLPLISKNKSFLNALIFSAVFSVSIEILQFIIGLLIGYRYRQVDIDDLLLNILGAVIGYLIYKIIPKKLKALFE